tara:strand:- start:146 stop:481 length:336 start_codon:yes stop_codon:yes gene_type:complete
MNKAYLIVMSRGKNIPIDGEEVALIIDAIQQGTPCKIKSGIFNPSFYVSIIEDDERMKEWRDEVRRVEQHNYQDKNYGDGKMQKEIPKLKPLKDVFAEVPLALDDGVPKLN